MKLQLRITDIYGCRDKAKAMTSYLNSGYDVIKYLLNLKNLYLIVWLCQVFWLSEVKWQS